jgi:hypothetical protein
VSLKDHTDISAREGERRPSRHLSVGCVHHGHFEKAAGDGAQKTAGDEKRG